MHESCEGLSGLTAQVLMPTYLMLHQALCPVVVPSRRPQAPALHWSWDMQVLTEGFTDEDLQVRGDMLL